MNKLIELLSRSCPLCECPVTLSLSHDIPYEVVLSCSYCHWQEVIPSDDIEDIGLQMELPL